MAVELYNLAGKALSFEALTFSGGERHVQLGDDALEPGTVIRANIHNATDIMDLMLVANALNAKSEATELYIEIPYLPYARQDRVCAPGQAFSLKVLANMLRQIENVKELVIWDCHSPVGVELTGATNIAAQDIIRSNPELTRQLKDEQSVIVCPDKGAVSRTRAIAKALTPDGQDGAIVYCEKVRDPATGQITHTDVKVDTLAGKTAIITDDICDGGYTFIKIAEQLRAKGADKIILFVTHGIFSKGLGVFEGLVDHIYTTQSFPHNADPRLTILNYAHTFNTVAA